MCMLDTILHGAILCHILVESTFNCTYTPTSCHYFVQEFLIACHVLITEAYLTYSNRARDGLKKPTLNEAIPSVVPLCLIYIAASSNLCHSPVVLSVPMELSYLH